MEKDQYIYGWFVVLYGTLNNVSINRGVSCIGGEDRRIPPACRKSLTYFDLKIFY